MGKADDVRRSAAQTHDLDSVVLCDAFYSLLFDFDSMIESSL